MDVLTPATSEVEDLQHVNKSLLRALMATKNRCQPFISSWETLVIGYEWNFILSSSTTIIEKQWPYTLKTRVVSVVTLSTSNLSVWQEPVSQMHNLVFSTPISYIVELITRLFLTLEALSVTYLLHETIINWKYEAPYLTINRIWSYDNRQIVAFIFMYIG